MVNNPVTTIKPQQQITLPTGVNYNFTIGARIKQTPSNAEGTVVEFDSVANPEILTVTDIVGTFAQGFIDGNGDPFQALKSSQSSVTIVMSTVNNGTFSAGDVITGSSSGATAVVTDYNAGTTTITANYVDSQFDVSNDTLSEPGGVSGTMSSASYSGDSYTAYPALTPTARAVDKKLHVFHPNHGMHNRSNNVTITGVRSEIPSTVLNTTLSSTATSIAVQEAGTFHKIINGQSISNTNQGYLKIYAAEFPSAVGSIPGEDEATEAWAGWDPVHEIVAYSAINSTGTTITVATSGRAAAGTVAREWPAGSIVECYNLDGIPLTEINKTHTAIDDPTLDSYTLPTTSTASVGIRTGGPGVTATQNVPFELITPTIQVMNFKETDIIASINTTSGTSIGTSGTIVDQASFVNNGTYDIIQINEENYFNNPRIICSQINEDNKLEGNKSFTMRIDMSTEKDNLTPVVDLDRVSAITTSNRINRWPGGQQVLGLQADIDTTADVSLLPAGDQNEAVYITKIARLSNLSRSIRIMIAMMRFGDSNIKLYYRIQKPGSDKIMDEIGWVSIPLPEIGATNVGEEEWEDFEYTVTGEEFQAFQIKIVMTGTNQAKVPLVKDMRAIAFAS